MAAPRPKVLATIAAVTLMLLGGCGSSPAPQGGSTPSTPSPAAGSSTATPTPTRAEPADERKAVEDASEKFVDTALTIEYAEGASDEYASRLKRVTTKGGYDQVSALLPRAAKEARSRFGENARSKPQILSGTKVTDLSADKASTTVNFKPRVQELKDGKWETVKAAAVDETAKLTLVKDGDRWLVDKFD